MDNKTSPLTISPTEYFELFGKSRTETWKALQGQRVYHSIYKYGIIDEVENDCLWIRFDSPEDGKERNWFPKKGFINGPFTELTVPAEYVGRLQVHRDRIAMEIREKERIEKERERKERETEFNELKHLFGLDTVNYPVDSVLFEILQKLRVSQPFTMSEVRWLLRQKLYTVLALYVERQYYRSGNLTSAIRARRWWNKAGNKERVEGWTSVVLEATMNFENELLKDVRKGFNIAKSNYPVYLDSDSWQKARVLALIKADFRCQVCNSATSLNVHHRTYDLGNENLNDLTVLCKRCHDLFHKNKEAGYYDLNRQ